MITYHPYKETNEKNKDREMSWDIAIVYERFLIIVFNGNLKVSGGLKCFVMQGEYDF